MERRCRISADMDPDALIRRSDAAPADTGADTADSYTDDSPQRGPAAAAAEQPAAPRPPVPHIPVEGSEGRPQQPAAGHGTHSPRRGLLLKFAVYCLTGLDCPLMNVSAHSEHVGLWVVLRLALCIFSCLV